MWQDKPAAWKLMELREIGIRNKVTFNYLCRQPNVDKPII